jgi:DNA-binding MarR family transcriptional regulator
VLSAKAVRAKPLVRGFLAATGVWSWSDDALCTPQHWGKLHYALDHRTRPLIADRCEDVSRACARSQRVDFSPMPPSTWRNDDYLSAWSALLRLHAALVPVIDAELTEATRIPLSWYDVMLELNAAEGRRLRMSELGEVAVLSRTRVSRVVDELERAWYVSRVPNPDDRRSSFAQLTPAGRSAFRSAAPVYMQSIRSHLGALLSTREAATLRRLLESATAATSAAASSN